MLDVDYALIIRACVISFAFLINNSHHIAFILALLTIQNCCRLLWARLLHSKYKISINLAETYPINMSWIRIKFIIFFLCLCGTRTHTHSWSDSLLDRKKETHNPFTRVSSCGPPDGLKVRSPLP